MRTVRPLCGWGGRVSRAGIGGVGYQGSRVGYTHPQAPQKGHGTGDTYQPEEGHGTRDTLPPGKDMGPGRDLTPGIPYPPSPLPL